MVRNPPNKNHDRLPRRWRRTVWLLLALTAAVNVAFVVLSIPGWVDGQVRDRLRQIGARLDAEVTAGDIELTVSGLLTIHSLTIRRAGVTAEVDVVVAALDPWVALTEGPTTALERLEIGAVDVKAGSLGALRQALLPSVPSASEAPGPSAGGGSRERLLALLEDAQIPVTLWLGTNEPAALGTVSYRRKEESGLDVEAKGAISAALLAEVTSDRVRFPAGSTRLLLTARTQVQVPFSPFTTTASVEFGAPISLLPKPGLEVTGISHLHLAPGRIAVGPISAELLRGGRRATLSADEVAVVYGESPGVVSVPRVVLTGVKAEAPGKPLPGGVAPWVEARSAVIHLDRRLVGSCMNQDWVAVRAALEHPLELVRGATAEGLLGEARGHRFGLEHVVVHPTEAGYRASATGRFGPADLFDMPVAVGAGPSIPTLDAVVDVTRDFQPTRAHLALTDIGSDLDPSGFTGTLHFSSTSRADVFLDVLFAGPGIRTVTATGLVAVRDTTFEHWRIAPDPIGPVDARATLALSLDRDSGLATADITDIQLGAAHGDVHLKLDRLDTSPRFDVRVSLPKQDCQSVADGIPRTLIRTLGRLDVEGTAWMEGRLSVDLANTESLELDVQGSFDECGFKSLGAEVDQKLASLGKRFKFDPHINGKRVGVTVGPGTRSWVPRKKIPQWLQQAALSTEDGGFYGHGALREGLLRGALKLNFKHRRYVYGGSTISQQLVKNLFLTRHKNLARKLQEAVIAAAMERSISKDRILELYLNCIEYGPKIWGIRNGAHAYFDKEVEDLTPVEGIWLMAIKPYPVHAFYVARDRAWNERWVSRMRGIFEKLVRRGSLTQADMDAAGPTFMPDFAGLRFAQAP